MSQPFIGEVRMCGFPFAPVNWAMCNGQTMAISQYEALYNLIGTTYGGDGLTFFNLPNLQSRICVSQGQGTGLQNYSMGQAGGTENVTLTTTTMPQHNHTLSASQNTVTTNLPSGNLTGAGISSPTKADFYTTGTPTRTGNLNGATISLSGGSQPHENRMPFQCVTFIIALFGIYPSQS
jgi:microcystin-dependent protein